MGQPSAEALLISALLHNGDVGEAAKHHITADKFRGYREEFVWLQTYLDNYGEQPSIDAFKHAFSDFPLYDHYDVRWAADQVLDSYYSGRLREQLAEAAVLLQQGSTREAYRLVAAAEYRQSAPPTVSLLTDLGFLDTYDDQILTVDFPWVTLQGATGGLQEGNYAVFAARLGQGKSAYLMAISCAAVLAGKRVLFFSLEMSESEVRNRFHTMLARHFGYHDFTLTQLRKRRMDRHAYKGFIQMLSDQVPGHLDVHTPASGPVSPATVAGRADDYDLVVIDYATLMSNDNGQPVSDDWRVAAQVSNRLKQVALAHRTRILMAAQVNREGDTAGWRPPKVKTLAQADAIGQDADLVVTFKAYSPSTTTFSIEKNRHGPQDIFFWTRFLPNEGIFEEITRDSADELRLQWQAEAE